MPTLSAKRLRKNYADLFPVFPIFRIYLIISKYLKKYNRMFFFNFITSYAKILATNVKRLNYISGANRFE